MRRPRGYEDIEHLIWAVKGPPSHHPLGDIFDWATVGACGDTPFGRFVSLGRLDKKGSIARQSIYAIHAADLSAALH